VGAVMRALVAIALAGCVSEPQGPPACTAPRTLDSLNSGANDGSPWLSADRRELIFASTRGAGGDLVMLRGTRASLLEDFVLDPTPVANIPEGAFDPFVVGKTLYYISGPSDNGGSIYATTRANGTFLVSALGDPVFTELGNEVLHPTLTADLLTIVYDDRGQNHMMMAHRDVADATFRDMHPIVTDPRFRELRSPAISLDGQRLAFSAIDTTSARASSAIFYATRAGDDFGTFVAQELGSPQGGDYEPFVADDGRTIVFASDRDSSNAHLWIYCE
jgi:hypothetical protein